MPDALPTTVVLCGGFGTRLRSVVADRPKVLAEVAGRPFLAYLLDHLADEGVDDVVLSAGHFAEHVEAFAVSLAPGKMRVRTVSEPEPLGTAGALRLAADNMDLAGAFLAINGDTFFSGSLRRLSAEHARSGALATLALVSVPDASRYGAVHADPTSGTVTAFDEKGASGPGWINAGAYALSSDALAGVRRGVPTSLERDVLPRLLPSGLKAVLYPDAVFLDIGTPEDYARAHAMLSPESNL